MNHKICIVSKNVDYNFFQVDRVPVYVLQLVFSSKFDFKVIFDKPTGTYSINLKKNIANVFENETKFSIIIRIEV